MNWTCVLTVLKRRMMKRAQNSLKTSCRDKKPRSVYSPKVPILKVLVTFLVLTFKAEGRNFLKL